MTLWGKVSVTYVKADDIRELCSDHKKLRRNGSTKRRLPYIYEQNKELAIFSRIVRGKNKTIMPIRTKQQFEEEVGKITTDRQKLFGVTTPL